MTRRIIDPEIRTERLIDARYRGHVTHTEYRALLARGNRPSTEITLKLPNTRTL